MPYFDHEINKSIALDRAFLLLEDAILNGVGVEKNAGPGEWAVSRTDNEIVLMYETQKSRPGIGVYGDNALDAPWKMWGGEELIAIAKSVKVCKANIRLDRSGVSWHTRYNTGSVFSNWVVLKAI